MRSGQFGLLAAAEEPARKAQYRFEDLVVPGAHADESIRSEVSLDQALKYLDDGALAWSRGRKCITCHTNGAYLQLRPALSTLAGPPSPSIHEFFVHELDKLKQANRSALKKGIKPTQIAYLSAGLAEWDAHVTGETTPTTDSALRLMFEVQSEDGSWNNTRCWPPFESSNYHGATVAAMAAATAPGWLEDVSDGPLREQVRKLKDYLKASPPHDYGRLLLLWTSTRMTGLLDRDAQQKLIETMWRHQRPDGGWSLRTFASPDAWGDGSRAEKLRGEPEFQNPPSDGHQTGLVVLVLRDAGIPADDPRIVRAVNWLKANQRESGRWWTRSLNTDSFHFITYSGTLYPLLALQKCGALTALGANTP